MSPENEDGLTMVTTTPEQQHEDEDVDLNKTVKRKIEKHLSQRTWKQNESKDKTCQRNVIQEQRAKMAKK